MSTNPLQQTLGDSEVLQQLDKQARRVRNRGLTDYVLKATRLYQGNEFRPEDIRYLVMEQYPHADGVAIGNSLATLARDKRGIERVGVGHSGLYRVGGTAPQLEDEAVLDQAMQALAALELMIKRHREVLLLTRTLKKALAGL